MHGNGGCLTRVVSMNKSMMTAAYSDNLETSSLKRPNDHRAADSR